MRVWFGEMVMPLLSPMSVSGTARNQKEMLRELYETRKKVSGSNDWRDWSFEEMRDECVR